MFNNVRIGDKVVPMLAMASVDIYYRNIFHEDAIKLQTENGDNAGEMVNFHLKMAFVMAKFAELKDRKLMAQLNEDAYIDWLDQFDRAELLDALEDIQKTYNGQMLSTSEAKKKNEEPTEN